MNKEPKQEKKNNKREWRRIMDNTLDTTEDQIKMELELFTASHEIKDVHYKLKIGCKVKFDYE